MADSSKEKLFSDFPPVGTQEWMEKISVDLKGADYEKKLIWKTNEGFKVKPFYRREDLEGSKLTDALPGEFPYLRGIQKKDNTWFIRQDIKADDAVAANAKALDILNKGVDSLGFIIPSQNVSEEFIEQLLSGICCECVELNFSTCQRHTLPLAKILTTYFQKKGYDPKSIKGSVNFDPIGRMMTIGKDRSKILQQLKELVETVAAYPHFRCVGVNSIQLNNAGAYIFQELGYALAWGNEYLSLMTEAGLPAALAAKQIKFNFGIGSNYFMEIAKFRAARMLWANIVKAYNPVCPRTDCQNTAEDGTCLCACKMIAHAETSNFNLTLFDAHVNLLRTQTEAMSAALAGVNSITVSPFDKAYETPNEFSERIARNQQLLLKEESHINKVVDPAAGSYYIEHLTDAIAQEAWKLFLQTEDEGGMLKSVLNGKVQESVNASGAARHEAVSKRKEILLGTNQYPNFNELAGEKKTAAPVCTCGGHDGQEESDFTRLNPSRAASQFEELRLATERSGKRPVAFMLTIGNLAMRQARAQFSCNFLACAGYKVIDNLGFASIEEGIDAALKANADIVVLCSSDDEYATYAVPAFQALDNRAMFIVAGAPACMDDLKAAGIENFIHVRCNVLETLKAYNEKLGIK